MVGMRGALWHRGLRKGKLEFSLMTGFRTLPGIAAPSFTFDLFDEGVFDNTWLNNMGTSNF